MRDADSRVSWWTALARSGHERRRPRAHGQGPGNEPSRIHTTANTSTPVLSETRHPPADRAEASRARASAYWASTSVTVLAFAGMGIANLSHADPIMHGLANLGYPAYVATMLGVWKVLAAAALLTPGLPRLREWAYAGMFFTLTGAALSHALNHDAAATVVGPLVLLAVVMASRALRGQGFVSGCVSGSGPSGVDGYVGH